MPTPFQHLVYAREILAAPALPEQIRATLQEATGPYFLGSTAVDVQAITGQRRSETHFYRFPPTGNPRAGKAMKLAYPELANPYALSPECAAFVSGYLVHLAWDEDWAWDVFGPFYLESGTWPDRLTRSVHHNALRVVQDREAEVILRASPKIKAALRRTEPDHWLPFVPDEALRRWRDWIVCQLENPARVQTAQVFAERMGVSVEHLETVVRAVRTGTYKPPLPGLEEAIARFEIHAQIDSIHALEQYWRAPESEIPFDASSQYLGAARAGLLTVPVCGSVGVVWGGRPQ